MKTGIIVVAVVVLSACSSPEQAGRSYSSAAGQSQRVGSVFSRADCERGMETKACIGATDEQCSTAPREYLDLLNDVIEALPDSLAVTFCALDILQIVPDSAVGYRNTANGGGGYLPDGSFHAVMGIREAMFRETPSLGRWNTWREQLNFGVPNSIQYPTDASLLRVTANSVKNPALATGKISGLLYVITHELGHIIDSKFHLSSAFLQDSDTEWRYETSWDKLNWSEDGHPFVGNEFPHRLDLCVYNCNLNDGMAGHRPSLDPALASQMFADVQRSDFISLYGSGSIAEDFAEWFAAYVFTELLRVNISVEFGKDAGSYSLAEKVSVLMQHSSYLEKVWDRLQGDVAN